MLCVSLFSFSCCFFLFWKIPKKWFENSATTNEFKKVWEKSSQFSIRKILLKIKVDDLDLTRGKKILERKCPGIRRWVHSFSVESGFFVIKSIFFCLFLSSWYLLSCYFLCLPAQSTSKMFSWNGREKMAFSCVFFFQMCSSHVRFLSLLHVISFLKYFLSWMSFLFAAGDHTLFTNSFARYFNAVFICYAVWILRIPSITFFLFAYFIVWLLLLLRQTKSTNRELNDLLFLLIFTGWLVAWFWFLAKSHLIKSRKNDE